MIISVSLVHGLHPNLPLQFQRTWTNDWSLKGIVYPCQPWPLPSLLPQAQLTSLVDLAVFMTGLQESTAGVGAVLKQGQDATPSVNSIEGQLRSVHC